MRRGLLRKVNFALNTFIGGIGATTTTAAQLAILLGITESDIANFSIISNNISCTIKVNYAMPDAVFNGNTEITYFEDIDGKCTDFLGTNHFNSTTALQRLIFNANLASPPFAQSSSVQTILLPNLTGDIGGCLNSNLLTTYFAPLGTRVLGQAFNGCVLLKFLNLTSVNALVSSSNFANTHACEYFNLNGLTGTIINGSAFTNLNVANTVIEMPNATSLVAASWSRFSLSIKKAIYSEITRLQIAPNNNNRPRHFVISKATTIGVVGQDYSVVTNNFLAWVNPGGGKVYVHASMQTINAGSPSADMDLLVSQGFTVIYVPNYTEPSAITDLSASAITGTNFVLNFTTPSSSNTIQHYDVYVDYDDLRGFILLDLAEVTATGQTFTIGSGYSGKTLKVKLRTIDIYYNRSGFSNEINVAIP